jgi:hypothetical protein
VPHPFAFLLAKGWETSNLNPPLSSGAGRAGVRIGAESPQAIDKLEPSAPIPGFGDEAGGWPQAHDRK